jgi:PAS domain S-box-containing protein
MEAALRVSEEKYRLLIENSHDIIYTLTLDGVFSFVSPSWTTHLGHQVTQVIGKPFQQFVHPDDIARCMVFLRAMNELGQQQTSIEYRVQHADGTWRLHNTNAVPLRDKAGTVVGFEGIASDITERKRTAKALQESEERYRRLSEDMPVFVTTFLPDGTLTYLNETLATWDDMTPFENIIGRNFFDFLSPADREIVRARLGALTPEQPVETHEERYQRPDGRVVYHEWTNRAFFSADGQPTRYQGIGINITERKRAEEMLRQANQNLEIAIEQANESAKQARMANAAKSEFLANMSHEIRTPLNGVIGMTGLLLDTNLDVEQHEYAQIAHKSGEALLSLINDILDLSKIEARKLELEMLDFDLRSTLKDTADLLALGAHEKGLELVCFVEPEVPSFLRSDPGRLRQILVNLGSNAVKFTEKGKIVIHASLENEDERNVTIRFSVSDTGIGIPANRQDMLFSPFTQVDGSTTRKYGGTGLGLAISKQIVELMGGRIGLESEVGKGSTFWFTAVFEKQPAGPGSAEEEFAKIEGEGAIERSVAETIISENDKRKIRILVAEDNPVNQKVAQAMLRKMGLRADVVANGQEAINGLQMIPYDLVLMDCQMPEMDGFEATSFIRKEASGVLNPYIPIVAMTASTMQGDRERCIKAGMNDFVAKPVKPGELAEVLARWLAITTNDNLQSE